MRDYIAILPFYLPAILAIIVFVIVAFEFFRVKSSSKKKTEDFSQSSSPTQDKPDLRFWIILKWIGLYFLIVPFIALLITAFNSSAAAAILGLFIVPFNLLIGIIFSFLAWRGLRNAGYPTAGAVTPFRLMILVGVMIFWVLIGKAQAFIKDKISLINCMPYDVAIQLPPRCESGQPCKIVVNFSESAPIKRD